MSNQSEQEEFEGLVGFKLGTDKHPQYTKYRKKHNINGNVIVAARVGDPRAPSRATDPRPGINREFPSGISSNPLMNRSAFLSSTGYDSGNFSPPAPILSRPRVSPGPDSGPHDLSAGHRPQKSKYDSIRKADISSPVDPMMAADCLLKDFDSFEAVVESKVCQGSRAMPDVSPAKPSRLKPLASTLSNADDILKDLDTFEAGVEAKVRRGSRAMPDISPAKPSRLKPLDSTMSNADDILKDLDTFEAGVEAKVRRGSRAMPDTSLAKPSRPKTLLPQSRMNDLDTFEAVDEAKARRLSRTRSNISPAEPGKTRHLDLAVLEANNLMDDLDTFDAGVESKVRRGSRTRSDASPVKSNKTRHAVSVTPECVSPRVERTDSFQSSLDQSILPSADRKDEDSSLSKDTARSSNSEILTLPVRAFSAPNLYTANFTLPDEVGYPDSLAESPDYPFAVVRYINVYEHYEEKKSFLQKIIPCIRPSKKEGLHRMTRGFDEEEISDDDSDNNAKYVITVVTYKPPKRSIKQRIAGLFRRLFRPKLDIVEELRRAEKNKN